MSCVPASPPTGLTLIVPCYNEEGVLPETHRQLAALMDTTRRSGQIAAHKCVCYLDDGSTAAPLEALN